MCGFYEHCTHMVMIKLLAIMTLVGRWEIFTFYSIKYILDNMLPIFYGPKKCVTKDFKHC